ncbi:unnamed protein product [Mytilus coruscus]|uniref:Uncharacterized protein n=1 Tax=Mytilus coruscus TaxID=42192 RepID=A0A6J8ANF7_MYTCO|nr:unnamed protein product [Mytilus coruscus]
MLSYMHTGKENNIADSHSRYRKGFNNGSRCFTDPMQLAILFRNSVDLNQAVDTLWNKGISSNTRNVYSTVYENLIFNQHISGYNSSDIMSSLGRFINLFCGSDHCKSVLELKYSTIKLYLAGVRFDEVNAYKKNPFCDKFGNSNQRLQMCVIELTD